MQGSDGNFYGTTEDGGANYVGTVFKITPSGTLTTLYSFAGSDGANPQAGLVQGSDDNFYGTAISGGANNEGTVFKVTPSGTLTTLYSFAGSDGAYPFAGVSAGQRRQLLPGQRIGGGARNVGTVSSKSRLAAP